MADFSRSPRESPGPRDWILDIYGSFVREVGGWIAVADLLDLLETVGVPAASGRSALSRMKRRGELEAISHGAQRGYALTEPAEQWFRDGTPRIMEGPPDDGDDWWLLASFTVPEQHRSARYRIRARLQELGFGQVAGGLMIAPSFIYDEAMRALSRAQFTDYVVLWRAEHLGFGEPSELVARAWDLDAIDQAYQVYVSLAAELIARPSLGSDEDAFVRYLANVNGWRDLPFLDPGIPLACLPDGWLSAEARATFEALASALRPRASRYFRSLVSS